MISSLSNLEAFDVTIWYRRIEEKNESINHIDTAGDIILHLACNSIKKVY